MINKVILIGRLGGDPDARITAQGTLVVSFNIATNETVTRNGERQQYTEWHRVVTFGTLADSCARFLSKGSQVYVEGSLRSRSWTDKNGITHHTAEVVARTVKFLDLVKKKQQKTSQNEKTTEKSETPEAPNELAPPNMDLPEAPPDEDLPF